MNRENQVWEFRYVRHTYVGLVLRGEVRGRHTYHRIFVLDDGPRLSAGTTTNFGILSTCDAWVRRIE